MSGGQQWWFSELNASVVTSLRTGFAPDSWGVVRCCDHPILWRPRARRAVQLAESPNGLGRRHQAWAPWRCSAVLDSADPALLFEPRRSLRRAVVLCLENLRRRNPAYSALSRKLDFVPGQVSIVLGAWCVVSFEDSWIVHRRGSRISYSCPEPRNARSIHEAKDQPKWKTGAIFSATQHFPVSLVHRFA